MIILTYLQVVPPKMSSRTLPNVAEEPMPYVSYQRLYNYKFCLKYNTVTGTMMRMLKRHEVVARK
jgi:hypothetical protein